METGEMLLIGVIAFIAIVTMVLIYAWFSLNALIKAAIERYGSQVAQTKVEIARVKIAPTAGGGSLSHLTITNPPGFSNPYALTLDTISTKLDSGTITQNPIIISEIIIHSPRVFFEINLSGKSNISALRKNIITASQFIPSKQKRASKKDIKLIIQRLVVEEGQIRAGISNVQGSQLTGKLPRFEVTDIGNEAGGLSPKEIMEKMMAVLINPADAAASELRAKAQEHISSAFKEMGKMRGEKNQSKAQSR